MNIADMKRIRPNFARLRLFACKPFIACAFLLFLALNTNAQSEKGLPFITNYSPKTFQALPQTWCVQEDDRGMMYFGIQTYILEYDGLKWRKITVGNSASTVVRSLVKDKNGTIYYGAYGDLGYLDKDSLGQTITRSLLDVIPKANRNFLDIWSSYATDAGIYFQSREYIFRISGNNSGEKREVKVWKPQTKFMYSFYVDGDFYVHQQGLGLYKMINDSLVLVPGSEFLGKERMQIMLPYPAGPNNEKQYLIGMFYSGLYIYNGKTFRPFSTKADDLIKSGVLLYKGIQLKNGNYVLSTTGKGLVIIDAAGNFIQKINRDVGLQDESIYSVFQDSRGTLWLALDNGISRVETASPLTKFGLQSGINTGVLCMRRFEGTIYIGTTNGLLQFDVTRKKFEPVPGIPENQIFSLLPDGNELLVTGDGLFAIKNKKVITIRPSVSGDLSLTSLHISDKNPDLLFGGGTFGVVVFTREKRSGVAKESSPWRFAGYVPGIPEQIWTFSENSEGKIWAGSANGVVYRLTPVIDENGNLDKKKTIVETFGAAQGLIDAVGTVASIKGNSYFVADSFLYTFNDKQKRFIPDTTFGKFPKGGAATQFAIEEDLQGRVWIRAGKETILATPKPEGGYSIDNTLLNSIGDFTIQDFYPEKNGVVWICTTDGLIRYDENLQKNNDESFKTILRHIEAGRKALSVDISNNKKPVSVYYKNNTLRFEYAAPFFEQEDKTQYQTWLEGFEKGWSGFDNNYYKEYTNLPPGNYHFHVRAKNIYQKLSDEAVYAFSISPPWYSTWLAYIIYVLIAIAIIYILIRWRTRQLHEKHRELEKIVAERTAQLSHRVEELAVINSVQDGLVREIDMKGIYELVGEKIREIFHAQIFDIVTYDSKTNLLEDHYSYEKGDRTLVGKWEPSGFRKMVIDTKQVLLINKDLDKKSQEINSKVISGSQPKSALFVPLISGGSVTGMISLQDLDKENAFSESAVNLLTTLANSMSVALESARRFDTTNRLLKETEQRNAQLAVINSVQESLVAKLDMQGIYELVGEKIREIFDAQVIDIVTYDRIANLIEDRYAYEKGDRTLLGKREVTGFRKHVIHTKQLLLHNENVEKATREFNNPILIGEMPKSQIYVPMMSGGEVAGIISLQNLDHEKAFSESDVNLLTTLVNSMSVALESARLFDETTRLLKETEQRNAELAIINSVQEGLASKLEIQGIYDMVGNKIQDIFDSQVVDIVTYDPATNLISPRYVIERGKRFYEDPRPLAGFRKHVVTTKQYLLINQDNEKFAAKYGNPIVQKGEAPKSVLFVPMIVGREVRGIISLQNLDHENAFNDADVRLLTTLSNSMSVALENARLFDETNRLLKETEQRNAELAVINSVQESLVAQLDMQAIYELVGEKMREIFNAQVIDIVTYDKKANLIADRYSYEKGDRTLVGPREPSGFRKHVIQTRQLLLHNENVEQAMKDFGNAILIGEMPKSQIYVPMMAGGEVNGIISLQNLDHEKAFSDSDVKLLTTLVNSMSVALESARLFDETTRLLKETEQRTAELAVINSVQEGLARELDIQAIYDLVGDRIRQLFDAQVVGIATLDQEAGTELFKYVFEKGTRYYPEARPYDKLRQHLIKTRQKILINNDVVDSFNKFGMKIVSGTELPKSMLFVPLIIGDKITSYVTLQNIDKDNAFSDSDVRLLETLANSMSVALENARLFDETTRLLKETEQRTAELAVINSVQDGLAKELDMQGIYNLVGDRVQKLFNAQTVIIASFDLENKAENFNYLFENGEMFKVESRPIQKLRQLLIDKKRSIYIATEKQASEEYGITAIGDTQMPKSLLFVPLLTGNIIKGYVSLQNVDIENAFSVSDIRLLVTLSNSMSVALENARLFDETNRLLKETEQRTAELAVINSVQDGLAKELDMQGIYNLVGDRIQKLFSAQVVIIATFDHENKLENFNYHFEKGEISHPDPRHFDKLRQHLIATGQNILINQDTIKAVAEYGLRVVPGTEMPKSLLFMPLKVGDKVNGYVSLQNIDKENAFSFSDVRLLSTLSNSMSVALENARLFDETTRLLKETEQRTAELAVINSVQEGLARELDIQAIYDLVGDRIRNLFNAQVVVIATLDIDAETEHFKYIFEKGTRYYPEPRPYDKLRQHLVKTRKKILINNNVVDAFNKFGMKIGSGTQFPKSMLFVPLVIGDKITSYVSLQNIDTDNAFSDSDVRLLETLANSMSVALENARLFDETTRLLKETEQRTAELAIINSVQDGLARELNIQGIYELVGEKMRAIFNAQVIDIVTYDKKTTLIEDRYTYEKGDRTLLGPRPLKGFRKYVIETAKPLVINKDLDQQRSKYDQSVIIGQGAKSIVLVPMIASGEVTGVISLQNLDQENAFPNSDVNLLTTLANSMSVALESARLFDETSRLLKETEQRTAELAVINSVQEGLAKELNIQGIYDLVGNKIRDLFDAQAVIIATFNHEEETESFNYMIEKGERFYPNPRPLGKLRHHLIQTKKKVIINKQEEGYAWFGSEVVPGTEPIKSGVFVPLIIGDKITSYVSLQNIDRENAFSTSDIRLLETLANSMSVALENARLFDETNRLLKETEQRTAELAVINSVQEGLAKELNMQAIYDLVGNKVRDVFDSQAVIIATLDQETGTEKFIYLIEKGERFYPEPRPYDKLRQQLIETKQKILINHNAAEALTEFGLKVVKGTEMPKSLLYVPLVAGNKVTSYVSLQNVDREYAFSKADVRLLETLANSMSVALENARLFDETNRLLKETEQRTAELAVINSVQEGLAKELDMQGIYDLVGERVQNLFQTQAVIIASLDVVNKLEHFNYVFENGKNYKLASRSINNLRQVLIDKKQTIYIESEERASKEYGITAIGDTKMPKSLMFVPLLSGNNIKGYVSIQNVEKEYAFTDSDIRLLETLANSMSVALENARLFEETNRLLKETEQRTEELAVINNVQEGLVREMNIQAIYNIVGNRICELFDTQTLVIRTFDHQTGLEHYQYAIEKGIHLQLEPRPFIWANKLLIESKQSLLINKDYAETAKKHGGKGVGKGLPPKSALFVPMVVGDVVKGSVSLQNVDREDAFTEADLRLLTTLTNSMSVALENARLFDETTHLLAEAKQRASELSTVNSISKALASQLDPDDLIKLVGDKLKDLFKANIVYLALLNKKTKIIQFPYQFGDIMLPLKLGEGLTSKIIQSGEPLLINKNVQELADQMGLQRIGKHSSSYLGVPIPVGDEIIGVLSVQSTEHENSFNESDQRLLSTIAASVGVALNNATLFEDVKLAKMEAEAASKAAEKANEAKSAFLSTVSHELRTPLTSVLGFAKIIRKRLEEKVFPAVDKSDAKTSKTINQVSENLQVVISEGERLTHLINDVLDLAKIEAGKMEWNQENVNMSEVAERAIAATTSLFDQKALKLIKNIDTDLPDIIGDRDKLIQVIINLISNSVKFTDKGSITCSVRHEKDEIIVSIADTGIGIAPEDFDAVFEQFKQVGGDTLTDKPKGTGLGLPICKEIVEHHGGRIWLESKVGKGSTFSFALPISKSSVQKPLHLEDLVRQLKTQMAQSKFQIIGKNATILVVDDDESIRSLLNQELSDAGYLIEQATNGKEALERIRKNRPDLIILDVMMPEMNGFDVAAVLKNDPQTMDIPIIVLSIVQDKARGFRIGVDRYLTKPIDTAQLFAEVGALLEQGKSKKKVMVVDEDSAAVRSLTDVLKAKGYHVVESDGKELVEKAISTQPDIIILNSVLSDKHEIVQSLRFEKGLENVLFLIYQ